MSDQYHDKIHAFASADSSNKEEKKGDIPKPLDALSSHDIQTVKKAFTQSGTDCKRDTKKGEDREKAEASTKKKELSFSDLFGEEECEVDREPGRPSKKRPRKETLTKDSHTETIKRTSSISDDEEKEIVDKRYTRGKESSGRIKELPPSPKDTVSVRRAPQGCSGVVRNVEHYPPAMVPRKLSRWMRSLFMGVPYSPNDAAVSFYVVSEESAPTREWHVQAVGNVMGLANGLHVEVIGRQNENGAIDARRIYHVTGEDPSVWPVLIDNRQRSAASVRILTLIGLFIAANLILAILSILIPTFRFLQAEWPTLMVYGIFIAIGVNWIRRQFRRFR